MTISPGARLGPYEITAAVGAGGMGEVFRAKAYESNATSSAPDVSLILDTVTHIMWT